MKNGDRPSDTVEPKEYSDRLAESRILEALWRWAVPILAVTFIGASAAWLSFRSEAPTHTVQSELLVRVGYEYSPAPWASVSETQQINFRADEVIGTEIQLITSERSIQKALAAVPHAGIGPQPAAGQDYDPTQILALRQKLAVKRLEGSNVILVELTDADTTWATAFSTALLGTYLDARTEYFSDPSYSKRLDDEVMAAASRLAQLDVEALQISHGIAETVGYLDGSAAALVASPTQPELRDALVRDLGAVRIYVSGLQRATYLLDTLDRLESVLASESKPATTTGSGNLVSDDLLKSAVAHLAADAGRLEAIAEERDALAKRLDTLRTAQLRTTLREEASRNMTIMTPPRALATSNGLDSVQRTVLAGLVALILSSLFFVYIDGLKRRSALGRRDA